MNLREKWVILTWDKRVPFVHGHLVNSPGYNNTVWHEGKREPIEWRDNCVFRATLRLLPEIRGHNTSKFVFIDEEGHTFEMWLHEGLAVFTHPDFAAGKITAYWTFDKRGTNYGIILVSRERAKLGYNSTTATPYLADDQLVNENPRGCRMLHKPSGVEVSVDDGCNYYANVRLARELLERRVYEARNEES